MASQCNREVGRLPQRLEGLGRRFRLIGGDRAILRPEFSFSAVFWALLCVQVAPLHALTPESEQVRKLIDGGLDYLDTTTDPRLGGKCVIALAVIKATGNRDHPRVKEAVDACDATIREGEPYGDVYSNGLAIIYLCELDPKQHRGRIQKLVRGLEKRQKPHGGWGYDERLTEKPTGDTSQTQYGVLACWQASAAGFEVSQEVVRKALRWLLRTQDPSGAWGYQGIVPDANSGLIEQSGVTINMAVAGLGCLLVCGDLLGVESIHVQRKPGRGAVSADPEQREIDEFEALLPPAITRATRTGGDVTEPAEFVTGGIGADRDNFEAAVKKGTEYVNRRFTVDGSSWDYYYLYSLERYKSFEEHLSGDAEEEPKWYDDGVTLIRRRVILPEHYWSGECGSAVDTAFAILFMVRSMRATLENQGIGGGELVGGVGLPQNVATSQVRGGQLQSEETSRTIGELLQVLEDPDHPDHERVLANPGNTFGTLSAEFAEADVLRLRRLVRAQQPAVRWLAVSALGRIRDLDNVPFLLDALTDPNPKVVLAARDGLRFVSRRFDGFGLPADFSDRQRYDALQKWKGWYHTIDPAAAVP